MKKAAKRKVWKVKCPLCRAEYELEFSCKPKFCSFCGLSIKAKELKPGKMSPTARAILNRFLMCVSIGVITDMLKDPMKTGNATLEQQQTRLPLNHPPKLAATSCAKCQRTFTTPAQYRWANGLKAYICRKQPCHAEVERGA